MLNIPKFPRFSGFDCYNVTGHSVILDQRREQRPVRKQPRPPVPRAEPLGPQRPALFLLANNNRKLVRRNNAQRKRKEAGNDGVERESVKEAGNDGVERERESV